MPAHDKTSHPVCRIADECRLVMQYTGVLHVAASASAQHATDDHSSDTLSVSYKLVRLNSNTTSWHDAAPPAGEGSVALRCDSGMQLPVEAVADVRWAALPAQEQLQLTRKFITRTLLSQQQQQQQPLTNSQVRGVCSRGQHHSILPELAPIDTHDTSLLAVSAMRTSCAYSLAYVQHMQHLQQPLLAHAMLPTAPWLHQASSVFLTHCYCCCCCPAGGTHLLHPPAPTEGPPAEWGHQGAPAAGQACASRHAAAADGSVRAWPAAGAA